MDRHFWLAATRVLDLRPHQTRETPGEEEGEEERKRADCIFCTLWAWGRNEGYKGGTVDCPLPKGNPVQAEEPRNQEPSLLTRT